MPLKILLTLEDHLTRSANGQFYVAGPAHYAAWSELLHVFDEVLILARAACDWKGSQALERVDGPGVSVHALPEFSGPWEFLGKHRALAACAGDAIAQADVFLLRCPGLVSELLWRELRGRGLPFGVEVAGDPWDAMAPGATTGLLRPLYRRLGRRSLRTMCANAECGLYWTRELLQRRYPLPDQRESYVAPRIVLDQGYATEQVLEQRRRRIRRSAHDRQPLGIGFLGSLAQLYKGPDTLLQALSLCTRQGLDLNVRMAGDGRYRAAMERLATSLGVADRVLFLGQLAGDTVTRFLDSIDLFVMPCRAEGLGRAFVEAMARGCPCIGANTGGMPELLPGEDLTAPGDPRALAAKIAAAVQNPARLLEMSVRHLQTARRFEPEQMRSVRRAFYQTLRRSSLEGREPLAKPAVAHAL